MMDSNGFNENGKEIGGNQSSQYHTYIIKVRFYEKRRNSLKYR